MEEFIRERFEEKMEKLAKPYSGNFKRGAVKKVLLSNDSDSKVARDLGLST